ncbi:FecR domain-containing protein [Chitinophaga pendula]|uniref:FecR family protein n=1 Tax=Chitinophaga TaxID=79328 RepID=UPI000BB09FBA|nr:MULTISPECIES: FecR family protein [Chitinophaga]ASZ13581.1 hypothetical protein CK934_22830 [Chitinophaga sp. MD30]UCJ08796.1 FecR domain-containing protein [Chitinophaga pendula]
MDLQQYKMEDFMLNDSFVRYCLQIDAADIAFWEDFKARHPQQQANINTAREWVLKLGNHLTAQDKQSAFEQLKARIDLPDTSRMPPHHRKPWYAAAAVLTMALIALTWLWQNNRSVKQTQRPRITYKTYKASDTQRRELILPDGSRIVLNANSRLQVPDDFGNNNRHLTLYGEAWCEIAPDETWPFAITAGTTHVQVLGTTFRIRAYDFDSTVTIALLSGKVKVAAGKQQQRELQPGQAVAVKENNIGNVPMDINYEENWQQGKLLFKDASLEDIAHALQNWYGLKVNLPTGPYKTVHFNGTFINKSLQDVTTAITYITGIKIDQKKGQLFISH